MMPRLYVISDYAEASDGEPTRPGDFETPGGLPQARVVHRIACPHHSIPWGKVIAVQMFIAAAVALVALGFR